MHDINARKISTYRVRRDMKGLVYGTTLEGLSKTMNHLNQGSERGRACSNYRGQRLMNIDFGGKTIRKESICKN
jgi:hypothetical protein